MARVFGFTAATRLDRRPRSALRVEALEDRLPPGDVLLGALLGDPLGAPELFAGGGATWTPADDLAGQLLAARRKAQPDSWTAAEPAPVPSVASRGGQGPSAGGWAGGAREQPTSTPAADEWFASVSINPVPGAGSIGHNSTRTAPESLAPVSAQSDAPTGAVNGGPGVTSPFVAQGGPDLDAPRFFAGRPAEAAGAAGSSPSQGAQTGAVRAGFDLSAVAGSPFPSNLWTVADPTQNTGRRVNLPLPDPATHPNDYQDTVVLNELDGFNLQPRLSIPFDGRIDPDSVSSDTVFLVRLGDTLDPSDHGGQVVGINQVVWDTFTNTLHVESDELLDQHTRYGLIVTNGVLDADGQPIQASEEFTRFRHDLNFGQTKDPTLKEYRKDLLRAVAAAAQAGVPASDIVTASVFTTQSATAILETIRDQIKAAPAPEADFSLGPGGARTVLNLSEVTRFTLNQQRTVSGPLTPVIVTPAWHSAIPGAVGQVAYGRFSSPDYEKHPGEYIPAVGTRTGTPAVQGTNTLYFTLFLPSGQPPAGGWPVVIWGHGGTGNKDSNFAGVPAMAATLAAQGIATIGINAVGHGFGPGGNLTLTLTGGGTVTLPAGGRAINQDGNSIFGNPEGDDATSPRSIISTRDARVQTAAEHMQLVRVIEAGGGLNVPLPDGSSSHLDPSRIYFLGASLSGAHGAPFLAVEPSVRVGILDALGGLPIDNLRLRPSSVAGSEGGRPGVGTSLAARVPSLINAPGVTSVDGRSILGPYFNENMPLWDDNPLMPDENDDPLTVRLEGGTTDVVIQSPVTNTVARAMEIQQVFENREWVYQSGNAGAYAPHLRKDPLPGVPAKSVLIQFAKGDQNIVNPSTTAFLRAGDLADRATYYRYDLAYQADNRLKTLPTYPHVFMVATSSITLYPNPIAQDVARGAQRQMATFLATDGQVIDDLNDVTTSDGTRLFEVSLKPESLPEGLNYIV